MRKELNKTEKASKYLERMYLSQISSKASTKALQELKWQYREDYLWRFRRAKVDILSKFKLDTKILERLQYEDLIDRYSRLYDAHRKRAKEKREWKKQNQPPK